MNVEYMTICVVLALLITVYYWFTRNKRESPESKYNRYVANNNFVPSAFTCAKTSDGKYVNYSLEAATGELTRKIENHPVTLRGHPYKPEPHGEVVEIENGFKIQGVDTPITCPADWRWDAAKKVCSPRPVCDDEEGAIKGLRADQVSPVSGTSARVYHDRVYAICGKGTTYTLGACRSNELYNQKATQPFTSSPCDPFDICSEHLDDYKHREKIDRYQLTDNEYYVCVSGKSVLNSCDPPLVYNKVLDLCVVQPKCWEKPNDSTIYVDANSYIICKNEKDYTVQCANGVYTGNGNDKLACVNSACNKEAFKRYFSNEYFNYPTAANVCRNNEVYNKICKGVVKRLTRPIQQSKVFVEPKYDWFDDEIEYKSKRIEYTDDTYTETRCVDVSDESAKELALKQTVPVSYNKHLPSDQWNFVKNRPANSAVKYFNEFGKITSATSSQTYEAAQYLATVGTNTLYRPLDVTMTTVDEHSGTLLLITSTQPWPTPTAFCPTEGSRASTSRLLMALPCVEPNEAVVPSVAPPNRHRFAAFAHMLFPFGDAYRSLIYNHVEHMWHVVDFKNSLISTDYVKLNVPEDVSETATAVFTPPEPTKFIVRYPSVPNDDEKEDANRGARLMYTFSNLNWYGKFVPHDVVRPHWALFLSLEKLSDLKGSVRVVASLPDQQVSVESFLNTCRIFSYDKSTNFDEPISQEFVTLMNAKYTHLYETLAP